MTTETLYVKGLPTPWLDMKKKRIWHAHDVFYAQTKIPSKISPFWWYSA